MIRPCHTFICRLLAESHIREDPGAVWALWHRAHRPESRRRGEPEASPTTEYSMYSILRYIYELQYMVLYVIYVEYVCTVQLATMNLATIQPYPEDLA